MMDVFYHELPFPHVTIENYYDEDELKLIWQEIDFLTHPDKLRPPGETLSAKDRSGMDIKKNHGIFLDNLYTNRNASNILRLSRKHFDRDLIDVLCKHHYMFRYIKHSILDGTLLSYYEDSDNYPPHFDQSTLTSITWLFKEPKRFKGGNLRFDEYNNELPLQNNFMVIFPSVMLHSVDPVKMDPGLEPFSGYGRYALSNFIQMR